MVLSILGSKYTSLLTGSIALIFFVFCSAAMLLQFYKREVVFAVREAGLLDKRWSPPLVDWSDMKAVVLLRSENEFSLEVQLWPDNQGKDGKALNVDLSGFDVEISEVVAEIEKHKPVRHELR